MSAAFSTQPKAFREAAIVVVMVRLAEHCMWSVSRALGGRVCLNHAHVVANALLRLCSL